MTIVITGFTQKYIKGPEGVLVPVDIVSWVPSHAPQSMSNSERVDRLNPDNIKIREGGEEGSGEKIAYMRAIWSEIEPFYEAWKQGREVPLDGTPLAAWPGVLPEAAEVLRLAGIRSVEQVRDMTDGIRARVKLPNLRELQETARIFLENSGLAAAAEREAEKDRQIAALIEQQAAMQALMEQLMSGTPPEVIQLRAQLDAKGIRWHHKAGADKLRELLATGGDDDQEQAAA